MWQIVKWGEKLHYASDILFEWHHVLFLSILFYIEGKWLLMRNLAAILPLKSELSGKFLGNFNAADKSIEMLKSWIFKNFN